MTSPVATTGVKIAAGVAAGVAALMTVGSYKAYSGVWQNTADVADREASINARLHEEHLVHTGHSFVPSVVHYFNRPDMFFMHKLRRAKTYATGFCRDVLWQNAVPIALGGLSLAFGFNMEIRKMIALTARKLGRSGSLGIKASRIIVKAARAVMPKLPTSKIIEFFKPNSPKGVLSLVSAGLLGLGLFPYMFVDAARGDKSYRLGEDLLHRIDTPH